MYTIYSVKSISIFIYPPLSSFSLILRDFKLAMQLMSYETFICCSTSLASIFKIV